MTEDWTWLLAARELIAGSRKRNLRNIEQRHRDESDGGKCRCRWMMLHKYQQDGSAHQKWSCRSPSSSSCKPSSPMASQKVSYSIDWSIWPKVPRPGHAASRLLLHHELDELIVYQKSAYEPCVSCSSNIQSILPSPS